MSTNHITVYSPIFTNRITYLLDTLLVEFSGLSYRLTDSITDYNSIETPKFRLDFDSENEIFSFPLDKILVEETIDEHLNYNDLNAFGKIFFWLTRYEEYWNRPELFDNHNRFLGSDLDYSKPAVDYLVIDFQNQLKTWFPQLQFKERVFNQINTHDVDFAWKYQHHPKGIVFAKGLKNLLKGNLAECSKILKIHFNKIEDPYDQYTYLKELAQKYQVETKFFWLLGDDSEYDKNLSWKNPFHQQLIKDVNQWAEVGIHPSYRSNFDGNQLSVEINRLSEIQNVRPKISRQHFIKLNFSQTYQQLLKNGIEADYTMGFAHQIGFRAGTSFPFKWFDLSTNQQTLLITYPFVAMDVTLKNYLKLTPEQAIEQLRVIKEEIKKVNGNFITIFHQSNLEEEWKDWKKIYESIFL